MVQASPATLAALELPALLRVLAEFCVTPLGRRRTVGLEPAGDRDALDRLRQCYEETRLLLVDGSLVGALEGDLDSLLERLANPRSMLEARDVLLATDLLRLVEDAATRIRQADDPPAQRLRETLADLPDTREFTRRVAHVLDARGRVRDDASPELTKLRRRVGRLRDSLYSELQGTVADSSQYLSEETIPLHEGRLVLLLKSGSRGQLDGLVHGKSGSGRSFYFEPLAAIEGNNRLRESIDDEAAERSRLLAELIDALRQLAPTVGLAAGLAGELDSLQAAARFAERTGSRQPDLSDDGELRLRGARHPLLDPSLAEVRERALGSTGHREAVVPLDLELGGSSRMLVITGPNAGGKTVALKTVGLFAAAAACGLPVPCQPGTRLPRLERLVATVGDEQDLLHDRSTFSARLLRLREAWEAAGPGALVLLDELGSGTDPNEGAALASALLEQLHRAGTLTLVTTHLTRLAALALETDDATCAAMEFDPQAGLPTFRLLAGTPGASEAIALARRLGLPRQWIDRATAQLDPEERRLRRLLEEVEETRRSLAAEIDALAAERTQLEAARLETEGEREELVAERRKVAKRLRAELRDFEQGVHVRLRDEEERLRDELAAGKRRGIAAAAAARALADAPHSLDPPEEDVADAGELEVGGAVRHRALGWIGRLEKLRRGRAEVTVQGKRMRCREEELSAVGQEISAPSRSTERQPASRHPVREVPLELHLIGERVPEALTRLDHYLDQALLANLDQVRIVHGHGSGRLRSAVRAHLAGHRAVASHRPGGEREGGEGATQVTLRD